MSSQRDINNERLRALIKRRVKSFKKDTTNVIRIAHNVINTHKTQKGLINELSTLLKLTPLKVKKIYPKNNALVRAIVNERLRSTRLGRLLSSSEQSKVLSKRRVKILSGDNVLFTSKAFGILAVNRTQKDLIKTFKRISPGNIIPKNNNELVRGIIKSEKKVDVILDIRKWDKFVEKLKIMATSGVPISNILFNKLGGAKNVITEIIKIVATPGNPVTIIIGKQIYQITDDTQSRVIKILNNINARPENEIASDTEFRGSLLSINKFDIFMTDGPFMNQRVKTKRSVNKGKFFKYTHNTTLDLSKYGIFKTVNSDNYNSNCFYMALKEGGLPSDTLDALSLMIKGWTTPMSHLPYITKTLKIKIILTHLADHSRKRYYGFENPYEGDTYHICLMDEHYFVHEKMELTTYAIKNYEDTKDFKNWNRIVSINRKTGKPRYTKAKNRYTDSFRTVKVLLDNRSTLLTPISNTSEIFNTVVFSKLVDTESIRSEDLHYDPILSLKALPTTVPSDILYTDGCHHKITINKKGKETEIIYRKHFFDVETYDGIKIVHHERSERPRRKKAYDEEISDHKVYLVRDIDLPTKKCSKFFGEDCCEQLLNSITDNAMFIAHNAKYDSNFMVTVPGLKLFTYTGGRSSLVIATGIYTNPKTHKTYKIIIKDSHRYIATKLEEFSKMFHIKDEKEVMPYRLYTKKTIEAGIARISDATNLLPSSSITRFLYNLDRWNLRKPEGYFDLIKYSSKYCKMDCIVLMKGYEAFRKHMYDITELNIDNQCSLARISKEYFTKEGCYENVMALSGIPRAFIQNFVVGGKVMTRYNNVIKQLNKIIADLDGVSLYPSAVVEMPGFLKGSPKVITKEQLNYTFLDKQDGYFVKIKITEVNKTYPFPILSYLKENGSRKWTNNMVGRVMYLDKTSLEDAIEFCGIEYELLQGYYFNEGRTSKQKITMKTLFYERLKAKDDHNPIQAVMKTLMNSFYGYNLLKPTLHELRPFNSELDFRRYWSRNNYKVDSADKICDEKYVVRVMKTIDNHFNTCHVGVEILSHAKRIMNRVICLAHDLEIKVWYTDTDSMHIDLTRISDLEKAYFEKYKRSLCGKDMGQFHVDFEMDGDDDDFGCEKSTIVAINHLGIAKKTYIDELRGEADIFGDGSFVRIDDIPVYIQGWHVRMKGVPRAALDYYCKERSFELGESGSYKIWDLYEDLYDGKEIVVDMSCGGDKKCFIYNSDFTVGFKDEFYRTLYFPQKPDKKT